MPLVLFILVLLIYAPSNAYAAEVSLNEIYPNPMGAQEDGEWIELFNVGETTIDYSGYILDDIEGGSDPYIIASGSSISPHGFAVFEKSETNIALNNPGDTVRLFDSLGVLVDSYSYASSQEEMSYGKSIDGVGSWTVCSQATKGASNACSIPTSTTTPIPTNSPGVTPTKTPTPTQTIVPTISPSPSFTNRPQAKTLPLGRVDDVPVASDSREFSTIASITIASSVALVSTGVESSAAETLNYPVSNFIYVPLVFGITTAALSIMLAIRIAIRRSRETQLE